MSIAISKITRAGQITLPKKIRNAAFAGASAVVFEERGKEVVIKPLQVKKEYARNMDHWPLVVHTNQSWLDPENDDLIELPKGL